MHAARKFRPGAHLHVASIIGLLLSPPGSGTVSISASISAGGLEPLRLQLITGNGLRFVPRPHHPHCIICFGVLPVRSAPSPRAAAITVVCTAASSGEEMVSVTVLPPMTCAECQTGRHIASLDVIAHDAQQATVVATPEIVTVNCPLASMATTPDTSLAMPLTCARATMPYGGRRLDCQAKLLLLDAAHVNVPNSATAFTPQAAFRSPPNSCRTYCAGRAPCAAPHV